MNELKVSSKSKPKSVAGAIRGLFDEGAEKVEIKVVGAGALNQAMKAVAVARGYLAPSGVDLEVVPSFTEVTIEGNERTSIRLLVKKSK